MERGAIPERIHFCLLPEFSTLSLFSALDVLRISNRLLDGPAYNWTLCSEDGRPIRSSLGIEIAVDGALSDFSHRKMVFVCGGSNVQDYASKPVLNWLRRAVDMSRFSSGLFRAMFVMNETRHGSKI
jgi:AraC family transcriptional regulator, glycine betaine-responsive activator